MDELIKKYSNIGGKKYGRILLDDFKKMIKSNNDNKLNDEEIETLFNLMDENETGYLLFRQYMFLCGILKYKENDEKMKKYYCEIILKIITKLNNYNEDDAKEFLERIGVKADCNLGCETIFSDYLLNKFDLLNNIIIT